MLWVKIKFHPKQALYQAELCPDTCNFKHLGDQHTARFYMFPRKFYMLHRVGALFQASGTLISAGRRARLCA